MDPAMPFPIPSAAGIKSPMAAFNFWNRFSSLKAFRSPTDSFIFLLKSSNPLALPVVAMR